MHSAEDLGGFDQNRVITLRAMNEEALVLDGIQWPHGSQVAKMSRTVHRAMCTGQNNVVDVGEYPIASVIAAIEYCKLHNYEKIMNTIQFPLECNNIEDNIGKYDAEFVEPMKDDFASLLSLFKLAKVLEMTTLYQLMAASIASFFRRRSLDDVRKDLNLSSSASHLTIEGGDEAERRFSWAFDEIQKSKQEL